MNCPKTSQRLDEAQVEKLRDINTPNLQVTCETCAKEVQVTGFYRDIHESTEGKNIIVYVPGALYAELEPHLC